jgi:hypothetical protein
MAVFSKQGLITELLDRTELIKASTHPFLRLSNEQLQQGPGPGKWCIAEIFGHLNITHDFYIRSILSRITLAPDVNQDSYRSGWLGDWVYERIMPRPDGSVFKMKAMRAHCPGSEIEDGKEVLESFLRKCDAIDDILRHVSTKDLQRIRIPLSVSRLVSLRLGDCLRFLVAHAERHLLQAQRVSIIVTEQ